MRLVVVSHPCVTPVNQDQYARVQARTGWQVVIVVPRRWRSEYGERRAERWPGFDGDLIPLPVALSGNIPLHVYRARIRRLLRAVRPDVVYVHNEPYAASTFQAMRAARAAGVGVLGCYSAQNLNKRYPWPVSRMEAWVHAHARFGLAVSKEVGGVLRDKGFQGRIEVLPLPIDVNRLRPRGPNATSNGRPFTAAYVGRLADEKGIDTLIDAWRLLPDPEARILIAGDGPAAGRLRARAAAAGVDERVTWAGYVPHDSIASVYMQADVVVVPSRTVPRWKEQFGRVVLEALACEVPVVTSDSGELPNLVAQTEGGWTFAEGRPEALADVLSRVMSNTAEARARAARGRRAVEKLFSADGVADRFAAVVRSACR